MTASAGTADDGTYALAGLLPGRYKLRYTAEGFDELWYPAAPRRRDGRRRSRSSRARQVDGLDVAIAGPARAGSAASVDLPESARPGPPVTVTHPGGPAAARATRTPPVPPAPPPIQQVTTDGQISFDGLRDARHVPRSRSRPRGSRRSSSRRSSAAAPTRCSTPSARRRDRAASPGTVRGSDGAAARQRRGHGHERRHREGGDDADRRATSARSSSTASRRRARTSSRSHGEGFSGQTIALDLRGRRGAHRRRRRADRRHGHGHRRRSPGPTARRSAASRSSCRPGDFTAQTATLTTGSAGQLHGRRHPDARHVHRHVLARGLPQRDAPGRVPRAGDGAGRVGAAAPRRRLDHAARSRGGGRPIAGATVELTDGETTRTTATAASPTGGYVFTERAARLRTRSPSRRPASAAPSSSSSPAPATPSSATSP